VSDALDDELVERVDSLGTQQWSGSCFRYTSAMRDRSQVREHDVSVRCVYAEVYAKPYAPVCLKRRQKLPENSLGY
jgi:hypothetical protein